MRKKVIIVEALSGKELFTVLKPNWRMIKSVVFMTTIKPSNVCFLSVISMICLDARKKKHDLFGGFFIIFWLAAANKYVPFFPNIITTSGSKIAMSNLSRSKYSIFICVVDKK
jgi:hypothetical protein